MNISGVRCWFVIAVICGLQPIHLSETEKFQLSLLTIGC